ncbi:amino acid ABC transporter substrate-binding protein [Pedobacter frigiditerrae]|uniref:Amino acid ABC transporter substrate-binding protein n=1 Tax=Pedobacter frigiditerrae TaxID=2530452 RepID=A0A4R0MLV1_9SPHI|nr:amino acid ABC transporter substrate-binding protein [Pedobacter frigiditerrae]TCC86944.1 amino acid ABC transporter substrate-binding protein [Pedobacter frigiditerrae]
MNIKNKPSFRILMFLSLVFFGCSPKVITTPSKPVVNNTPATKVDKPVKKFTEANISLIIPFKLNELNLQTATKAQVEKSDMALDFYQGVMLGIDSAAANGLNFKLNVFDSRDENSQIASLLKKETLKNSNLIIGPVFPEGMKYMTSYAIANDLSIVSPLAASKPSDFNNPKLISIVNNINLHGGKIVAYIAAHYKSENTIVVLINPKKSADEQFAAPIRDYFKQKHPSFIVQEFTSAYAFETRMIKGKQYAVVICSSDVDFVKPSIDKLYKLKNLKTGGYDINLFGHPNWSKQNYVVGQLQDLNTIISSSFVIDYKSSAVINFIKKYRGKYHFEPSEFSFKGFDIGFYFGKLLAKHGENYLDFLAKEKYKGLHNTFEFDFNPQYGYFNKQLMLLQYKNLTLSVIN